MVRNFSTDAEAAGSLYNRYMDCTTRKSSLKTESPFFTLNAETGF
jgi:hypothetical protein